MYLIGADHPHKRDVLALLERLAIEKQKLVTNAEVLQEILYRYSSIGRREAIQPAFDTLYRLVDGVFAVEESDLLNAKDLLLRYVNLDARDAVHVAAIDASEGVMCEVTIREGEVSAVVIGAGIAVRASVLQTDIELIEHVVCERR